MIGYNFKEFPPAQRAHESYLRQNIVAFLPPLDEPDGVPVGYWRCFAKDVVGGSAMGVHFYFWDDKLAPLLFIDSSGYDMNDCRFQLEQSVFPNLQYFFDQLCWEIARRIFPDKNLPPFTHHVLVPTGEMSQAPVWTSIKEAVEFIQATNPFTPA